MIYGGMVLGFEYFIHVGQIKMIFFVANVAVKYSGTSIQPILEPLMFLFWILGTMTASSLLRLSHFHAYSQSKNWNKIEKKLMKMAQHGQLLHIVIE